MLQADPTHEDFTTGLESFDAVSLDDTIAFEDALDAAADATIPRDAPMPVRENRLPASPARPLEPKIPGRIPPITLRTRMVSGRYRGTAGVYQLELRVDVDRTRPLKRLSGDFYQVSGATTTYIGSFVVKAPTITVTPTLVTVKGAGTFTMPAGAPVVQVTIPRRSILQPQGPATVQFYTAAGAPGATYLCTFESPYFRTVRLETDRVSDVTTPVFNTYDTGSMPSGGPARTLSVVAAYAEAGIEVIATDGSDVINVADAGNAVWSNAELHASMEHHFSLYRDVPQWAVWEVVAQKHDLGAGLYGIMFDQQGKQRQGCAVFHQGIGGTTADKKRLQLYTYVHELGHCFNLLHSWQKSYAVPPQPNRPTALSWMNYPWNYPNGGAPAFWQAFPFQFDAEEVLHLRHAPRNDVIMGGSPFATGSALAREIMASPISDDSGVTFRISTHQRSFALGEPVVLELQLSTTNEDGRRIHTWLHPNCGMVKIVMRKPNGEVVAYQPLVDHLVGFRGKTLKPGDPEKDSAYIGYGKDGLYFDQPGQYTVRAAYAALDGSEILSDILTIRVRYPVTTADEAIADLFMGDEQGTLLYLLGSDAECLRRGNYAFDEVLEKHGKHPMANYVRLLHGMNAGREFKTIGTENVVQIRKPHAEDSARLLSAVADSGVLDPFTTQQVLTTLADAQVRTGNKAAAEKTRATLAAAGHHT